MKSLTQNLGEAFLLFSFWVAKAPPFQGELHT